MNTESEKIRVIRLHKKWADSYTLLSQIVIMALFVAVYFLSEQTETGAAERTGAFVLLATIVLAAVIWQALGLAIARLHMLRDGVDLEGRPAHGSD